MTEQPFEPTVKTNKKVPEAIFIVSIVLLRKTLMKYAKRMGLRMSRVQ